jgi:hypothetical protein
MRFRLNDKVVEYEPRRITDVAELKRRMANGALLYWTMVHPAHAVLFDPEKNTVAQLAFFKQLWGLQHGRKIRHDRYEGNYSVFVPTARAAEKECAAKARSALENTLFSQSEPVVSSNDVSETVEFDPSI